MTLGDVSLEDAKKEVEVLSRVGLHENIIWCFGAQYLKAANIFHIFLEFVEGKSFFFVYSVHVSIFVIQVSPWIPCLPIDGRAVWR